MVVIVMWGDSHGYNYQMYFEKTKNPKTQIWWGLISKLHFLEVLPFNLFSMIKGKMLSMLFYNQKGKKDLKNLV